MYNTQEIAKRIKSINKTRNEPLGTMLSKLDMGINTVSELGKGKQISYLNFAKIADYLNVSVDYLLGRTDEPHININNSYNQNGNNNFQTVGSMVELSKRDAELLQKVNSLNFSDYADIINYINEKLKNAG